MKRMLAVLAIGILLVGIGLSASADPIHVGGSISVDSAPIHVGGSILMCSPIHVGGS